MTPGASSAAAHVAGAAAETASAQAVAAECQRAQLDHSWRELAQCADRLKPLDPRPAAELAMRATKELDSAPHVTAAHAALRDGALKRAKAEIDQVWPGSVDCAHLKHAYDAAEAHRIDALAAQLDRVKDASCEAYPPAPRQVSRLGPAAVWFCCDLPQLPQSTWLSTNGSMSQIRVALLPHVLPLTGGGQSQRDDCAL